MTQASSTRDIQLQAIEVADSRGRPTVGVTLSLGKLQTYGDVPAGASKGEDEAQTVPVADALETIRGPIQELLWAANADLCKHAELLRVERALIERSGENHAKLGANAVLPVSRALWRVAAALSGQPLFAYIRENEPDIAGTERVHFLMNIFNGGLHALRADAGEQLGRDRIDIQEIMVVPVRFQSYKEALQMGEHIDQALKRDLQQRYGVENVTRGDEAGFTVKGLGDSSEAIARVFDAVQAAGYRPGADVKLALDVAASSFFDASTGTYRFRGESLGSDEMIAYLTDLVDRYAGKVLSVEDGLAENDWEGWPKLTAAMRERSVVTIGDDLFVTQQPRLQKGINLDAADAILVKVNQNGSVTGTLDVMKQAKQHGIQSVISHRSGETLDDSIADLAAASGAFGLKTGDPQPEADFAERHTWVRRAKYLRMVEIEQAGG